jgi:hypothetical protein
MTVELTKTRQQLKERAATELGFLPSNATLSDEDGDTLDNLVDPLVMQLEAAGIISIGDTDAIESQYFLPLARLLANEAATSFGQTYSAEVKAANEDILRLLTAPPRVLSRLRIEGSLQPPRRAGTYNGT